MRDFLTTVYGFICVFIMVGFFSENHVIGGPMCIIHHGAWLQASLWSTDCLISGYELAQTSASQKASFLVHTGSQKSCFRESKQGLSGNCTFVYMTGICCAYESFSRHFPRHFSRHFPRHFSRHIIFAWSLRCMSLPSLESVKS